MLDERKEELGHGGPLGLDVSVTVEADLVFSFSKTTSPHQMMRLILLEQIYRSRYNAAFYNLRPTLP
jgi:23S rRNA pseudoU1915 N3-methylase RlmH